MRPISILLTAAACLLLIAGGSLAWAWWGRQAVSPAARHLDAIVMAAGDSRVVQGRLTGGSRYTPLRAAPRNQGAGNQGAANQGPVTVNAAVKMALAQLEALARERPSADNVRALAAARLSLGDTEEGVRLLAGLAAERPDDGLTQSDLSAAYLQRASDPDRAEDWVRALAAAERAVRAAPERHEPLFNRALCITALGLRSESIRAWKTYLAADTWSPWGDEARRQLTQLEAAGEQRTWADERPRILRLASTVTAGKAGASVDSGNSGDSASLASALATYAQEIRALVEDELLPEWGRRFLEDPRSADAVLVQSRTLSSALLRAYGDRLLSDAVENIDAAVRRANSDDARGLAEGLVRYGAARRAYEENKISESEPLFRAARARLRDNPIWLWCELHLAIVEYYRGRLPEALRAIDRLTHIASLSSYRSLAARAHWMAGLSQTLRARYTRQIPEYRQAVADFDELRERANAGAVRSLLAGAYQYLGDRRQVWRYTVQSLRMLGPDTPFRRRHTTLIAAATRATRWGMPEASLVFVDETLEHASRWKAPEAFVEAGAYRARALASLGRAKDAAAALDGARARIGETPDPLIRARLSAELAQTEAEVFAAIAPERAVAAAAEALKFFEGRALLLRVPRLRLAEGRAFRRLGDLTAAARSLQLAASRFEAERADVPADDPTRISHFDEAWGVYRELFEVQQARRAPDRELLDIAERGKARTLAERIPGAADEAWLARLQKSLAPRTALIYYVQRDAETLAWVVTRHGLTGHRLALGSRALDADIAAFGAALARPSDRLEWQPLAERLHAALIEPLGLGRLDISTLVIVPDGSINRLPFAALRHAATGRFLAEDYVLSFAPSGGFAMASNTRAGARRSPSRVLAVAVDRASPEDGLPRIPAVIEEAGAVAQTFPNTIRLTGEAATIDAVRRALPDADVWHFAGHAVPNVDYPQLSRLFLSDGAQGVAPVLAEDLNSLDLANLGLVVLASCSGVEGPLSRSEGLVGLSRAFLLQGVPSVLVSRWEVDDRDTSRFIRRFYAHLSRRERPAAALAAAVRESLAEEPSNHAWAAWLFVGGDLGDEHEAS